MSLSVIEDILCLFSARVSIAGVAGIVFVFVGVGGGVGVNVVVALALIVVRAVGLWSGWSFSGYIGMSSPIMGVNGLGEDGEFREGVGFSDAGDLVLDSGQKTMVELLVEGGIPPLDVCHKVVKVDVTS